MLIGKKMQRYHPDLSSFGGNTIGREELNSSMTHESRREERAVIIRTYAFRRKAKAIGFSILISATAFLIGVDLLYWRAVFHIWRSKS